MTSMVFGEVRRLGMRSLVVNVVVSLTFDLLEKLCQTGRRNRALLGPVFAAMLVLDLGMALPAEPSDSTARSLVRECLDLQTKTDQISTRGVIESQSGHGLGKNIGEFWLRRNGKFMDISGRHGPPDAKFARKFRLVFDNDYEVDYSGPVNSSGDARSGIAWHKDLNAQRIHTLTTGADYSLPLDGYLHGSGGKRAAEVLLGAKDLRIVADELIDGIHCSSVAGTTDYGRIALSIARGEGSVALPRKTTIVKEPNDLMLPGKTVSQLNDFAKPGKAKRIGYSEILDQVTVERTAKGWVCVSGRLTRTDRLSGAADKVTVILIKRKQTELQPAFKGTDAFVTNLRDGAHVLYMDDPKSGVEYAWHDGKVEPVAVQFGGDTKGAWPKRSSTLMISLAVVSVVALFALGLWLYVRRT